MKRAGQIALGLALGAAILVSAGWLMGVDPAALWKAVGGAAGWTVPVSVGALFVLFAFGALRWNGSLKPVLHHTFWQGYYAMLISYPVNAILPAKGGDLFRLNLLAVRSGQSRATILGGEIMDKAMDLCGPLPIIAVLLVSGLAPAWVGSGALIMASVLIVIAGFMVVMRRRGPVSDGTWWGRMLGKVREAYVGRSPRQLATTALVFAPLPWLGESAAIFAVAHGFGLALTPVQAFCVLVALKVGMVVPTPGGIGSVEVAGAAALVFFGAPAADALACLLVYRSSQLLSGSVVGAVFIPIQVPIGPGDKLAAAPAPAEAVPEGSARHGA